MKHIDNMESRAAFSDLYGMTSKEKYDCIRMCDEAGINIGRLLYVLSERAYEKAEMTSHFDGWILRIPGHHGDIAFHYGTSHNYETYGTVADFGEISRTVNPVEALVNLLNTPEYYVEGETYKKPCTPKLLLKMMMLNKFDETPRDQMLKNDILAYVYENI